MIKEHSMRIFATSDIHIDHKENREWLLNLSAFDYKNDLLILGGDISDLTEHIILSFNTLQSRFKHVCFVPGNHDLWLLRNKKTDSLTYFHEILQIAADYGIEAQPKQIGSTIIVPLFSWYDFTFGPLSSELKMMWMDFRACKWSNIDDTSADISNLFHSMNTKHLETINTNNYETVISFSHFMPRIDIMPEFIPEKRRKIYPVLGSIELDKQIKQLGSYIHVYGHSHFNLKRKIDNTLYINNAYGYPYESYISSKELLCIHEI